MNNRILNLFYLFLIIILFNFQCNIKKNPEINSTQNLQNDSSNQHNNYIKENNNDDILIQSFLGNATRNYYGNIPPSKIDLIWKCYIGGGKSKMPKKNESGVFHYGAGWTGQPILLKDKGKLYILQGSYDHNLRKIDAETGEVIWKYKFDDAIKGTGSIWYNSKPRDEKERIVIIQGSRQGVNLFIHSKFIYSLRGISAISGEELYRINVENTPSYSRDVDASALIVNDTAYIGLENGIFLVFNPDPQYARKVDNHYEPEIIHTIKLYTNKDILIRGGHIITEGSPSLIGRDIYIAAGSGYVYKYNIDEKNINWEYYIGSDLDGTCTVTSDSCILVSIEKQFIQGNGGMLKLNPNKNPTECVEWFFPTNNKTFISWMGGVIGSAAVNDNYLSNKDRRNLAAFSAIDGNLYVIDYKKVDSTKLVKGFDNKTNFYKPELIFKYSIGPSISTPIIFADKLIACGYGGIYLFDYNDKLEFTLIDKKNLCFEATPIVWNKKVFVAAKDGYLYCFGEKNFDICLIKQTNVN